MNYYLGYEIIYYYILYYQLQCWRARASLENYRESEPLDNLYEVGAFQFRGSWQQSW